MGRVRPDSSSSTLDMSTTSSSSSSSSSRFLSRTRRRRAHPPPVHPQTPVQSHKIFNHMPPRLTTNVVLDQTIAAVLHQVDEPAEAIPSADSRSSPTVLATACIRTRRSSHESQGFVVALVYRHIHKRMQQKASPELSWSAPGFLLGATRQTPRVGQVSIHVRLVS